MGGNPEDSGNSKPRAERISRRKKDQLRDEQQSKKFRKAAPPGDSCFKETRLE